MAAKFMSGLHLKKGALRATAKREGLIKGDEPLSILDVRRLKKSKNPLTRKRATLAQTFMRSNHA